MEEIDRLLTPDITPSHKYYWTNLSSRYHISRMLTLASFAELQGDVNGVAAPNYLMHRADSFVVPEGNRRYEFQIEYDIYNPSYGIYFGCKSVTLPGHKHPKAISCAVEDWKRVKPHITLRLNNTFIDKDFSHRFKDPDNARDNTFWPFWISLHEDENPREFAMMALSIIAATYKEYFEGTLPEIPNQKVSEKKDCSLRTAFTESAYMHLQDRIKSLVKAKVPAGHLSSEPIPAEQQAWHLFEKFIVKAEEMGIVHKVAYYERAWMLDTRYSDVDFKCMMKLIFRKISESMKIETMRIPWGSLIGVFLQSDGTTFKQQIKTVPLTAATRRRWTSLLSAL